MAIKNLIIPLRNGPLHITGTLILKNSSGKTLEECEELFLCRCGKSNNKPYCDGEHKNTNFEDNGMLKNPPTTESGLKMHGPVEIKVHTNGPLIFNGAVSIQDVHCKRNILRKIGGLCRCGNSANSPFCDGTHSKIEFNVD